jgi:Transglycosylase SLT domain
MAVPALGAEPHVMDAIKRASARSGVGFDYLLATAQRESGLDCEAKSKSSSACGLYQFVAQTWLSTLKAHGAEHGLGAYADAIERNAEGQYQVRNPAQRAEILALREDPSVSAALAADLTADNARILAGKLGRPPSGGELYAAHVLGASGAAKLIGLAETKPGAAAADFFGDAAAGNRGLFYDRAGAAVSLAALARRLTGGEGASPMAGLESSRVSLNREKTLSQCLTAFPDGKPVSTFPGNALRPSLGLPGEVETAPAMAEISWPAGMAAPAPSAPPSGTSWGAGPAPLALTPQVLAILASLDAPETAGHRTAIPRGGSRI